MPPGEGNIVSVPDPNQPQCVWEWDWGKHSPSPPQWWATRDGQATGQKGHHHSQEVHLLGTGEYTGLEISGV